FSNEESTNILPVPSMPASSTPVSWNRSSSFCGLLNRLMSPIAATIPAATARLTPAIVINLLTAGSSIASCAISRSSRARSFRQPVKLTDVPIDRCAFIVRQLLSGQPRPATGVEKIGMRALRDQVRVQDRMHLVLEPRAMPHDLVAPCH